MTRQKAGSKGQKETFNIHVRALGTGVIIWIGGLTTLFVVEDSPYWALLYLLLIPVGYALWINEKAKKGV